jgi:cell division protein FtsI (penicillin-binding protein 3)
MRSRLAAILSRLRRRPAADPVADGALRQASSRPRALTLLDLSEGPDPAADLAWRTTVRRRVGVAVALLALWTAAIQARLVYLHIVRHAHYLKRAEQQQEGVQRLPGTRGDIVDRRGSLMAYSVDTDAIVAHPNLIRDPAGTVARLCAALRTCTADERARLLKTFSTDRPFAYVRRSRAVRPEDVARVMALGLPGISTLAESRRWYPNRELGAHVLGFVGQDDAGLGGIEAAFDPDIRGREGVLLVQKDGGQQLMRTRLEQPPTRGATLELTIDLTLQYVVERELGEAVRATRARGGTAIVMDPHTGEVLALANEPTFNPNDYGLYPATAWKNRAVQDIYEPGSTFKIVTAAAALEEGVVRPADLIDTSPGYIKLPGRPPIEDVHAYDALTFEDVIVKSSNVGAIRVGLRTGADRLGRFVRRFGLGQALEPHLPGQSRGLVHSPADLDDSGLASVSMGYQIGVTPLQMATVASVVANGGLLMEPHVVRAVVRDGVREATAPRTLRRAIGPETAAAITTFMEGVVERGTGTRAQLDGYRVAAKSGTAARIVGGRYSATDYNASIVGFVPSRRPVYTILVVIDTPRGDSYFGGAVAAPVFQRIADAALRYAGTPRSIDPLPPVVASAATAGPRLERTRAPALLPAVAPAGGRTLMPDVRGLGAREALRALTEAGLFARLGGSGLVLTQFPEPGEPIERGGWSVLKLGRPPAEPAERVAPGGAK